MSPGHPSLIDRTGTMRLATADPDTGTISISEAVVPPKLDEVLLHEVAHAVAISYGLLDSLHGGIPESGWVHAEEWAAGFSSLYGAEMLALASESLGRPLCIRGLCRL